MIKLNPAAVLILVIASSNSFADQSCMLDQSRISAARENGSLPQQIFKNARPARLSDLLIGNQWMCTVQSIYGTSVSEWFATPRPLVKFGHNKRGQLVHFSKPFFQYDRSHGELVGFEQDAPIKYQSIQAVRVTSDGSLIVENSKALENTYLDCTASLSEDSYGKYETGNNWKVETYTTCDIQNVITL